MREGRQVVIPYRTMSGVLGQGDTKGAESCFFSNLSNSNLLLVLFSRPTVDPDGAGACALKFTLIYAERRREAGGGMEGEGEVG